MIGVDDGCGWEEGDGGRKKVGISSLSKKWVIRQAQSSEKALVGITVLTVWN